MRLAAFLIAILTFVSAQARAEPYAKGPMLVCFRYSTFELAAHERITDFVGGVEGMGVKVRGPRGSYWVYEGEIFARPRLGRRVSDQNGTSVYWLAENPYNYAVIGKPTFSDDEQMILRLQGEAFTGTASDARIYKRFVVIDPSTQKCRHRFDYGWHLLEES